MAEAQSETEAGQQDHENAGTKRRSRHLCFSGTYMTTFKKVPQFREFLVHSRHFEDATRSHGPETRLAILHRCAWLHFEFFMFWSCFCLPPRQRLATHIHLLLSPRLLFRQPEIPGSKGMRTCRAFLFPSPCLSHLVLLWKLREILDETTIAQRPSLPSCRELSCAAAGVRSQTPPAHHRVISESLSHQRPVSQFFFFGSLNLADFPSLASAPTQRTTPCRISSRCCGRVSF